MVVTPTRPPVEPTGPPLSPLALASTVLASSSDSYSSSQSGSRSLQRHRRTSGSSFSKLSEFSLDPPLLDKKDQYAASPDQIDENGVNDVRHVALSVDASEWRHPVFKQKVLAILRRLHVPRWSSPLLTPTNIHLQKVSGAMTNAVFFVSFNPAPNPTSPSESPLLTPTIPPSDPSHPPPLTPDQYPHTLLFRVYGPSSDALISRSEELRILHVLSTQYGIGPRIFGTFTNGRVEEFFPSRALTAQELRDPIISRGIARRMRELHSVDLRLLGYEQGRATEPALWICLKEWSEAAEDVISSLTSLGGTLEAWVERLSLHRIQEEISIYRNFVESQTGKGNGVVFAHNDTHYGNLLRLDVELPPNTPEHCRYIVIDFEYASPNPRGYDIANHFHEWRADYHHPTLSHSLIPHFPYPTPNQREDFYRAYLSVEVDGRNGEEVVGKRKDVPADKVAALEREVRIWSPGCSINWALWGLVQAEEQICALVTKKGGYVPEFDYLAYATERLEMFRDEAKKLGVPL
ncbi:choline kinase [Cryptococcus bacillisporus CA1873]|uniref:Choline kinase n=1 Tax=Cryptococcus bacillisporus CA1873 TaxID=1296111 RepID=A0ABR5B6P9_CRYGA|nr:choline kinase [Cryptococcus bacillisporus CA1873]|eukprot:KIR59275.1 choline kinase [Cryptococcus gattii CA1873]